nr:uncharacterized protein LOC120976610 isoform X2 [Aegilops tauschii subsp. strangulata]
MRGELGAALVASDPSVKAKRSKATPVVQRAPSMRADAKLGDIMSLESAKLRAADKNRMCQTWTPLGKECDERMMEVLERIRMTQTLARQDSTHG